MGLSGRLVCEAGEQGSTSEQGRAGGQDAWVLSWVSVMGMGAVGWGMDPFLHPGALQPVPARCVPVPQRRGPADHVPPHEPPAAL